MRWFRNKASFYKSLSKEEKERLREIERLKLQRGQQKSYYRRLNNLSQQQLQERRTRMAEKEKTVA